MKAIRAHRFGGSDVLQLDEIADPVFPQPKSRELKDLYLFATGLSQTETQARAARLARDGHRVTVFAYGAHARFHTVRYTEDGYWLHQGGIYGRG